MTISRQLERQSGPWTFASVKTRESVQLFCENGRTINFACYPRILTKNKKKKGKNKTTTKTKKQCFSNKSQKISLLSRQKEKKIEGNMDESDYRSRYLPHAKRALCYPQTFVSVKRKQAMEWFLGKLQNSQARF